MSQSRTSSISKLFLGSAIAAATALFAAVAVPATGNNAAGVTTGDKAPDFTITDTDGNSHTLSEYTSQGKVVVIEWFNPDCPFVKKFHSGKTYARDTYNSVKGDDVVWLAINSGAPGKQGAGLERNQKARADYKIEYPVLLDETGKVGRAYGAKRTPEMFVIDASGTVAYHGPIDNNASARKFGETNYITTAVEQVLAGETVVTPAIKPYGCSVKYGG